jgi:repressor of nif and glnA expression
MESSFMVELYDYLARRSHMDDVINIMDNKDQASSIAQSIEKNGVQIIEGTKTNQTFKIGEKTYTVTVKKAETTLHYTGRTNREAIVEVSDGTTTCSSYAIYKTVDENLCKTENLEYFTVYDDEDEDGNKLFYVSRYKNTDHEQFLKCLSGIALPITEAP